MSNRIEYATYGVVKSYTLVGTPYVVYTYVEVKHSAKKS